jgi:bile acid:Na+ symporter, BASS family
MILNNRNFIVILAVVGGMLFPEGALWTTYLILPLITLIMTLSIMEIDGSVFRNVRSLIFPTFLGILMNYAILGNLIILMSAFLIHDGSYWLGFVTLAAVPSAVGVIPFTRLLNGNTAYAMMGTVNAYIGALVIIPLITLGFLDITSLDQTKLIILTVVLIAVPVAISRILIWKGLHDSINTFKGKIINWSFFLMIYTLVGLNWTTIMTQPFVLAPMALIAFTSTFLLGFIIQWIGVHLHANKNDLMLLLLFGTLKNYGLAGAIALFLFGPQSALPAVVFTIFMTLYVTWLDVKNKRLEP